MPHLPIEPYQWRDSKGEVWTLHFKTSVIRHACADLGISLGELQKLGTADFNFGKYLALAWYGVGNAPFARGYKTQEEFEDACMDKSVMANVLAAVRVALKAAFPSDEDQGGESTPAPLAETPAPQTRGEVQASRGNSETSSS